MISYFKHFGTAVSNIVLYDFGLLIILCYYAVSKRRKVFKLLLLFFQILVSDG